MGLWLAIVSWVCSAVIGVCAYWISRRKKPIHFLAGSSIEPKEITDVPAYNRANAFLWAVYAASFFVTGISSLFSAVVGILMLSFLFIPCIVIMLILHKRIYNRHKQIPN